MARRDPLRLLEAAYAPIADEAAWLKGVADAAEPFELGGGVGVYVSELADAPRVRTFDNRSRVLTDNDLTALPAVLPPHIYSRLHAPMPLVSSDEHWPAVAREMFGMDLDMIRDLPFAVPKLAWACAGGDAQVETALVVFHCERGDAHTPRDRETLDCFAAHLGAALRLRARLVGPALPESPGVDAVVAPDGRLLHAEGEAVELRESLIEAVMRWERARLRDATPEERLDAWTALVEGRWSILESVERDGRRTLLACKNDPRAAMIRALDARERAVVEYVALGHAYKYIAYELGVAIATVAATLESAMRKLGVSSRGELIQIAARLREK